MKKITKAVFPVAGMGTRFLPATKSIPKEIMTLVDRPLIQYSIDEARSAGIDEFIFVTARGKTALEDYFDRSPELERKLKAAGKEDLYEALMSTNMESGSISYIRQNEPRGLGDAILCAKKFLGEDPFVVILPDIVPTDPSSLKDMIEGRHFDEEIIVGSGYIKQNKISSYGMIETSPVRTTFSTVTKMIEKPKLGETNSTIGAIGRYILTNKILRNLEKVRPGVGNEIQLTDAIAMEVPDRNVSTFVYRGDHFDCGSKIGLLCASAYFGLKHPDLKAEFSMFLRNLIE